MRENNLNGRLLAILDFITAKFVMGCETLHFVLYSWSSYLHFFSYVNITKLLKFKMAIVCYQKLIRSLADIAEHSCQIKRRSDGNFFMKRANELFVIKGLMIWGSKCHQNNSPVVCDDYVK